MFARTILTALVAGVVGLGNALPLEIRDTTTNSSFLPTDIGLNITYSSPYNASLPNLAIFATGGTIAGVAASSADSTSYTSGVVGVAALIAAVPSILTSANIQGSQISNIGSESMNATIVLKMSHLANEILCSAGSNVDALVITHGTDTLEETAFFMDATVNCAKPVVLVGAMRPSTAISADGPSNLLSAVHLAVHPDAQNRGAMIVLNDRIGSAYYTEKTNGNSLDTFKAVEQGYLGAFLSTRPVFYFKAPSQPLFKQTFDVSNITELPKVDVLYGHQDFDWLLIRAAVANGAKGVVIAGVGAGSLSDNTDIEVAAWIKQQYPIVASSKTENGAVVPGGTAIGSGYLNPVKSRIQLQLALATGQTFTQIKTTFEGILATYVGNSGE